MRQENLKKKNQIIQSGKMCYKRARNFCLIAFFLDFLTLKKSKFFWTWNGIIEVTN